MRSPSPVKSVASVSPGEHQGEEAQQGPRGGVARGRKGLWREVILEGLWGGPQAGERDRDKESQGRWVWGLKDRTVLEAGR